MKEKPATSVDFEMAGFWVIKQNDLSNFFQALDRPNWGCGVSNTQM